MIRLVLITLIAWIAVDSAVVYVMKQGTNDITYRLEKLERVFRP
jgi:hypothetical protein